MVVRSKEENHPFFCFPPGSALTKEQQDAKSRLAQRGLQPTTFLARRQADEIKKSNRELFTRNPKLGDLVEVYFFLEELGEASQMAGASLTDFAVREWVSLVNLGLEMRLGENLPDDQTSPQELEIISSNRELLARLLGTNRLVLKDKKENYFYSLGWNLRREIISAGVWLSLTPKQIRDGIQERLKTPEELEVMLAKIKLPWLAEQVEVFVKKV